MAVRKKKAMKWPAALLRSGLIHFAAVLICLAAAVFIWAFLQNPFNLYRTGLETHHPRLLLYGSALVGAGFASWTCACLASSKLMYIYTPLALAALAYTNSCQGYALAACVVFLWLLLAHLLHSGLIGQEQAAASGTAPKGLEGAQSIN